MKQTENLRALRDAFAEAHDYVSAHMAAGNQLGVPFNPRSDVMSQVRDAMRLVTFQTEGAARDADGVDAGGANVAALSTHGIALIDSPAVTQ